MLAPAQIEIIAQKLLARTLGLFPKPVVKEGEKPQDPHIAKVQAALTAGGDWGGQRQQVYGLMNAFLGHKFVYEDESKEEQQKYVTGAVVVIDDKDGDYGDDYPTETPILVTQVDSDGDALGLNGEETSNDYLPQSVQTGESYQLRAATLEEIISLIKSSEAIQTWIDNNLVIV